MIPDFQSIMQPLLQNLKDGKPWAVKDIRDAIVKHFSISKKEQQETIPSGKQFTYSNRIAWALSYLKMAELIVSPTRGVYQLSEAGQSVLESPPEKIDISFLKNFPAFIRNRTPGREDSGSDVQNSLNEKTPDELIEIGYHQIRNQLAAQLLQSIENCSPYYFEKLVVDVLIRMGYGGADTKYGEITKKTGDEGIDGIIKEDPLGLDKIYLQAKKWGGSVGRPELQKFVGALQGKQAKKGVFITTSGFSKGAIEYARNLDVAVVLIDGVQLADYMIQNEVGVSLKREYRIYSLDSDYFIEED